MEQKPELSPRSRPFLTSEQREALDAALAEKQDVEKVASEGRRWMVHRRSRSRDFYEKMDRKSRSGKGLGGSKKGGAGGKYTWGSYMEDTGVAVLDQSDPNYDSDTEVAEVSYRGSSKLAQEVEEYKEKVASIVSEYYDNGDINEAATLLDNLKRPHFAQYFVKKAITMSMDRRDKEREMTSYLLSSLYNEVIYPEQMRKGFEATVYSVDDLKLDVPEAAEYIALFLARAVVDDVLPPAMIARLHDEDGSTVMEVRKKAETHLSARHCTERMLRCWGAGAGMHYQDTKDSIAKMLFEYTSSHDVEEMRRCLRALDLPFFHHEFVKQAVHLAMENQMHRGAFIEMLVTLSRNGDISEGQMTKGFERVAMRLDDTILDNPAAEQQFAEVVGDSMKEDIISKNAKELVSSTAGQSDSGFAVHHPHSIQSFKQSAIAAIEEFFESSDMDEVAERILELEDPGLHHIFVKHAVIKSMDRRDREREMISNLLSFLYPQVLSGDQLGQGFTRLLLSAEDLVLDNPEAVHSLTNFLGRIIVDEIVPPSFLTSVLGSLKHQSLGVQIVEETGLLLSARHASERLLNCWHGGSKNIEEVRSEIRTMLKEYLASKEIGEIARCLHELGMPFYHHEFVRRALEMALDSDANLDAIETLFFAFSERGEISETQMKKGFERMEALVEDLALDYPNAKERFSRIKKQAVKEGWTELKEAS